MALRRWVLPLVIAGLSIGFVHDDAGASEPVDWSGWYAGAFGGHLLGELTADDPSTPSSFPAS